MDRSDKTYWLALVEVYTRMLVFLVMCSGGDSKEESLLPRKSDLKEEGRKWTDQTRPLAGSS